MTRKMEFHGKVLAKGTALVMLGWLAATTAGRAQDANTSHSFSIPSQSVASALVRYSAVTGANIVYDGTLPATARSSAIQGQLPDRQALQQLLSGTGLGYTFGANDTITIVAPSAGAAAAGSNDETALQPIVLSGGDAPGSYDATESSVGTKTDTPLRDVPQSIQVVKRSVLEDQQATSLTEALENVSNVRESATSANRASSYMSRGFTSNSHAVDGVMLDGAANNPEYSTEPDMAGIERVEVLKGPASVLYGRGQPGGLINIVTRQPTEELTAEAKTQVGSYGFRRAEATISGPLDADGTLTGRIIGAAQHEGSFVNERPDSERQYIGGVLQWQPDTDTKVNLSVNHTHQDQPYDRGLVVSDDGKIHIPYDRFLGEDWSMVNSHKTQVALTAEHQAQDWLKFRGSVRYNQSLAHDRGIDFRGLEDDGRTLNRRYNLRTQDLTNLDLQFETVMTFDTGEIGHTVLAGVEHVRSSLDFWRERGNIAPIDIYDPVYGAPMTETSGLLDYTQDMISTSVYLQDQIDLSDQWKLLAGLRYDHFDQDTETRSGDPTPSMDDGALTWRAGIVYQPVDTLSFYTSYATSFMPQSGLGEGNTPLDPEKGWQIEAGVKADLIPDRLSATFSVFQITKNNVAVSVAGEDYSRLTGQQRSRGFEVDMTGEITSGWKVIGSLGYLDAEVTKDGDVSIIGNRLIGTPHWSGSLWTTYEFQEGKLEGLKLGTGITAIGKRYGDLENSFFVDGYYRLDASVSYKINENLDFSLIGRNLTDQRYIETTASRTDNYAGAPINVMAALKASF
ncbi:TonB-dependent siderophore receptor [Neorhizobium alkalisoli]|uniref:Iron complex outermembrane receptor protein n=1 Tax=Neorhizobium alkalisoli TaxID=528178 RepID=A0A561R8X9_9HYPH|nr:TonB-dependent receptor [Neorhizobium alkalisoli]TWF59069.1 iron complex outermembrane receptor protein [Neorhizobium alkalisoli]